MILAGIDIGTNTLRLLVAEAGPDSFQELSSDRRITRLGQGLDRTGLISREAAERSLSALAWFVDTIRKHSALHTVVAGTSALRKAGNSPDFIAAVKKTTGLELEIISGEEEARLTLLGVARALKDPEKMSPPDPLESALILDIGGGSTEIILMHPGAAPAMVSLPLGAVYLTERFIHHDPPDAAELEQISRAVREELQELPETFQRGRARVLAGTAGTITTLAAVAQGLSTYDHLKINRYRLSGDDVDRTLRELCRRTQSERRELPGLEPGREDIILAGAVITRELMERYGYADLLVSDWGLREGLVIDLYEKLAAGKSAS